MYIYIYLCVYKNTNSCTHVCVCPTKAHVLRGQHLVTLTHRSAVGQAALCSESLGQASTLPVLPTEFVDAARGEAWKEELERICSCPSGILCLHNLKQVSNLSEANEYV